MPPTLIDLSMPIVDHWRFSVSFAHKHAVAEGQPFTSTTLDIAAHAFTHVDAPSHSTTRSRRSARSTSLVSRATRS